MEIASSIVFEKKGKTAYIILNRPEKRNAINFAIRQGLCDAWEEIDGDPDILSVIVTGGEKIFSSGQDLLELLEFRKKERIKDLPLNELKTFGANVKKPIIAAISGYCLGGGFLFTMVGADVRIASSTAKFGMPEVEYGLPLAFGIPPLVGKHFPPNIAMEILLFGNLLTAEDAYRCGYINRIVAPEDLISTAENYAEKINKFSPVIVKNIKQAFTSSTALEPKAIALSDAICQLGRHSEEYIEGQKAFIEKRKPVWDRR